MIRKANHFDIPAILDMLRGYRNETPLDFLRDADDAEYVSQMLYELIAGRGVILIAEVEDKPIGMMIAAVMPSIWSPKHFVLTEFAYWVEPERRGGTAGYRLLRSYLDEAIALKDAGRICNAFISKMVNSPDLKYSRFGFSKLEEFWVI
jgi:N-acetylglutamate synthase-like GNAT family acetyltransferase